MRQPLPPEAGQPARYDVEYQRHGVRNLLLVCEPRRGWRDVTMTTTRNRIDFAHAMKQLVQAYASAEVIRVVLDNLTMHKIASLYDAFPPDEARALARKLQLHDTPKHGSWLNMAEIEFAVLGSMCLQCGIADEETLRRVIAANVTVRNTRAAAVK